jgi:hypothetical protein
MLVRMLKTAAGPHGIYAACQVCEMPDAMAQTMVAAGAAVPAGGVSVPPVEMAVAPPPENADVRPQRMAKHRGT